MSFFSAFTNSIASTIGKTAESTISTAAQRAVDKATSRMSSVFSGGAYKGLTTELSNAKAISQMAMRIRYAQGWQWNIEIDGFSGLDMYVKDITYGFGNIETETTLIGSVEYNKPTHATAGTLTVTVRDNENRDVRRWFLERKARVTNTDGTLNLPMQYMMTARIYSVSQEGEKKLLESVQVFPTQFGECSFARDQINEFSYYPLTFMRYSSAASSLGGIASNMVGSAVSGLVGSAANSAISSLGGAASSAMGKLKGFF